jgi:probable addiction module antidote protein
MSNRDTSYDDYLLGALKDPKEAAGYIEAALELNEPAVLLLALRQVAKAHGMAEMARRADMGDKSLFRALSASGNPTLVTVHKVLHAVGLRLSVEVERPVKPVVKRAVKPVVTRTKARSPAKPSPRVGGVVRA